MSVNALVLALLLLLASATAHAVNCTISTSSVNFGAYDFISAAPLDSTGTITINCNNPSKNPLQAMVTLSTGSSGSYSQRQMTSGSKILYYNLYSDTSKSTVVGDGSGGTNYFIDSTNRTFPWTIYIYGRIPARQNVTSGSYNDSLTATVIW
jgi:spore coat protein U-like protein